MIQAKHIGRLCNSLFQISAAIGYARKYGFEWAVDPGSGQGAPYSGIHNCFPNLPKGDLSGIRYHEHPHGHCPQHNMNYDLCHFDYHELPNLGPNVVLSGFFQSWKYFKDVQDEVRKVFELPHIPEYEGYTSIHYRLGDYLQHSGSFPPITNEYVRLAMRDLPSDTKYLVFSDDIPRVKDMAANDFPGVVFEYSEGRGEKEDLSLMASCRNNIIANSTFSWWAGFLNKNPGKIIISPSGRRGNWFGISSGILKDVVDLHPPEWSQISFR